MTLTKQNKWLVGGLGLTLLLMGVVSFASYKNINALKENANKVQKTYEILNNLSNFYASMTVAESGRRGYIATGEYLELKRHHEAVRQMETELSLLKKQFSSATPAQQKQIAHLKLLVKQRLALLKQSIALYQQNPNDISSQRAITVKSVKLREEILVILAQIKDNEQKLLENWLARSRSHIESRVLLGLLGTLLSFIVIDGVFLILYYQWKQDQVMNLIQQDLRQKQELLKLKNELFSMISHEFRTPLSVILSSSQLLENNLDLTLNQAQLKNIYRIQASVRLMNQFLTDLLTLARAESGNLDFNLELLDIETFCLNLVEELQFLASKKHLINLSSQGICKRVYFDEKLLYSILSNVLLNAIKYSPDGGKIDFILRCEAQQTIFVIKDQGIGIPFEDQAKIYQPFYRGQNVAQVVGTGLGLAVVQKCLELYHGTIEVESQVAIGTQFTITIPHLSEG